MHCTTYADVQHSLKRQKARIKYCCRHCMRNRSSPASSGAGTRLPCAMASTQPCMTACVHGVSHPGCTQGASPCFNIKDKPPSRAHWLRQPRLYQDRPLPCSQARNGKERSMHTCSLRNAHQALWQQQVAPAPGDRPQVCRPSHGGKQTQESELALARHYALRTLAPLPCQGLVARVSDQTHMNASQPWRPGSELALEHGARLARLPVHAVVGLALVAAHHVELARRKRKVHRRHGRHVRPARQRDVAHLARHVKTSQSACLYQRGVAAVHDTDKKVPWTTIVKQPSAACFSKCQAQHVLTGT